ncbi:MAG: RNA-binding S4 domain-containing protein [bacterium]|nr:RNA-binding S4 domain-containing protein [bacterium]
MRIDKFLKVSRLIKRRAVANEACDQGRILANGRVIKASYDVRVGDVLEITMGERVTKVKVTAVAEHVLKDDASSLYEVI